MKRHISPDINSRPNVLPHTATHREHITMITLMDMKLHAGPSESLHSSPRPKGTPSLQQTRSLPPPIASTFSPSPCPYQSGLVNFTPSPDCSPILRYHLPRGALSGTRTLWIDNCTAPTSCVCESAHYTYDPSKIPFAKGSAAVPSWRTAPYSSTGTTIMHTCMRLVLFCLVSPLQAFTTR